MKAPLLEVRGLRVLRPDGAPLFEDLELTLRAGEVIALLGSSGAGKSTLLAALHEPEGLRGRGFTVSHGALELRAPIGVVPQRGALFDHLSVAGNLELALRNADQPVAPAKHREVIESWLAHLDLPREWSGPGHDTGHVSGGEAQRLAVARTLAGGRRVLFLDEPSVGLDPLRVRRLAAILRRELQREGDGQGAAALVITHDLHFAAAFADRFLYLDPETRGISEFELGVEEHLARETDGARPAEALRAIEGALSRALVERLEAGRVAPRSPRRVSWGARLGARARSWLEPFSVITRVLSSAWRSFIRGWRDVPEVARVVLSQGLLRPAPFFAVVSTLIGFTILYIFHRSLLGGGMPVRPDRVFGLIGSMHIVALAPPLSGILFAATSASAITAWLGGMSLTRQTVAMRALGIDEPRYLWAPAWFGLALAYLVLAALFVAGMVLGGTLYLELQVPELSAAGPSAFELVTADLLDPPPGRVAFVRRAALLILIYAAGIASDAVAKGARDKSSAESVTVAMVRSVMACTMWIVAVELLSLFVLYRAR